MKWDFYESLSNILRFKTFPTKKSEQNSRRLIDTEKGLVVTKGEDLGRVWGEGEWDQGAE